MTADTLPHNTYLDAFLTERPKDGIEIIQGRLRKALKLNEELAEYFRERAHVEDLYAKNLAKISKKHFVTDKLALGQMQPIWDMLYNELTEIYTIHSVMSLKITEDVERPLRSSIQNDNEYAAIKSMDATLQKLSKDYEERLVRLNKHKKAAIKPGTANGKAEAKVAESAKGLEEITSQWLKTGPDYIQKHQTVDEHRWDNLRTAVQNFEVLQNDQLLKRIEVANNVLTAASNLNVQDEITAFCSSPHAKSGLRKAVSMVQMNQQQQQSLQPLQPDQPQPERRPTVSHSEQSITSLASTSTRNTTPSEVLSVPSSMNGGGASSIHSHHLEAPVPVPSVSEKSNKSGRKVGKERKFLSTLVSIRRKTKSTYMGGSDSSSINNGYVNADLAPPDVLSDQRSHSSFSALDEEDNHDHTTTTISTTPSNQHDDSPVPTSPTSVDQSVSSLKKAPSLTGSFASSQQQQQQPPPKVLVDAEGYTIPPPDRAAWPSDNNINNGSSLHDDDFFSDNGSVFSNQQSKLKVDIKNEVKEEDAQHAAVALTRVSSMLKEKSPTMSGKRRGRRETQRNTRLLDPVQESKPASSPVASSPLAVSSSPFEDDHGKATEPVVGVQLQDVPAPVQLEDPSVQPVTTPQKETIPVEEQHIHGAQLFDGSIEQQPTIITTAPVVEPPTAKPNIKVHITESMHCLMKGGTVVRSTVLGEVKIAYHGPADTMGRPVYFRLEHVDQLERITPNTGYIRPVSEEEQGQEGVYQLDTNMFNLAGDSPIPCIKYQVKQQSQPQNESGDNNNDDMTLPIQVKPMWKCEDQQTLLLVKYQKNQHNTLAHHLHGIFFMTTVSGNVQNVQSVPGGQWMVDQDKMVWPMGEWQGNEERVLRAKFSTKEQGSPQSLQIRFEVKDRLVSSLDVVNNNDESDQSIIWASIESTEKSIRTGKYVAEQ
ncbi:Muniscin C-terminal mu homology domain-containing protein [Phascolomyces articulosus]|uniref:Muniscin C-terminal mu homology domain-containing protein n=1 Tax=Phascolomyces articulosus TaxID=60185 RepID=A0AAD5PA01_9FUNG|nr:Muniscin C-terminal mu homology domain-containing protein [Phascolomyces articulosus]